MTEKELRQSVVKTAEKWLGVKEGSSAHKEILKIYNDNTGGYNMTTKDAWCAAFVSAVFIKSGMQEIAPTSCSCSDMISKYKARGAWQENDAYVPSAGDLIMYDWKDSGKGDNTGAPAHVGIVVSVANKTIKVIEGNKNDAVEYREIKVNGRYIRGFCLPQYRDIATAPVVYYVGDVVQYNGQVHYISAMGRGESKCIGGKAKVTSVQSAGSHPYHLVHCDATSTVYGWVKESDIGGLFFNKGDKVTVKKGAKTYDGKSLASFVYDTVYTVIESKNDRVVIGLNGKATAPVNAVDLDKSK